MELGKDWRNIENNLRLNGHKVLIKSVEWFRVEQITEKTYNNHEYSWKVRPTNLKFIELQNTSVTSCVEDLVSNGRSTSKWDTYARNHKWLSKFPEKSIDLDKYTKGWQVLRCLRSTMWEELRLETEKLFPFTITEELYSNS